MLAKGQDRDDSASLNQGITEATALMEVAAQRRYTPVVLDALLLSAFMYEARGEPDHARGDVRRALELAEQEKVISLFVEHGAAIAEALAALLAHDDLGPVQPDYVRSILDAFRDHDEDRLGAADAGARDAGVNLVEALTDRELEVLRLMAQGLTYQQVADELFVSLNTVRTHVKAVYGKLGVSNKTQAIEAARMLSLL